MKERDICEGPCINDKRVNRLKKEAEEYNILEVSNIFKALSDVTRLRIAYVLSLEEELCVCEIAQTIGSSIAAASHHLRLLKKLGLAKFRKAGKLVYYSLDDEHVKILIQFAFTHQKEVMARV